MQRGLVTRGVNVRPNKPQRGSAPPTGIVTSRCFSLEGAPGRPLPGYRSSDFGLRTRTRKHRAVKVAAAPSVPLPDRIAQAEGEWQAAVTEVAAMKAQGLPQWKAAASRARSLRARLIKLQGGIGGRIVDVDQGAAGSMAQAMHASAA